MMEDSEIKKSAWLEGYQRSQDLFDAFDEDLDLKEEAFNCLIGIWFQIMVDDDIPCDQKFAAMKHEFSEAMPRI